MPKKWQKKHWHDIHVLNILIKCIVKLIYWKMINSGCLLVLTLTDPFYVLSCFKICDPAVTSLILLPFFLPLVYFLAGSTTCTNPEEPDHVRLLPWAWRVRHQWPFPAGIDTSSPVYVATFKSAISDVGWNKFDMPPCSKNPALQRRFRGNCALPWQTLCLWSWEWLWMINFNMYSTSCFPYMHWSVNMQNDWQVESADKFYFWLDESHLQNLR